MIHGILTMLVSWARWLLKACHYAFKSQDNKPNRVGRGPFGNHVDPIPEIGLKFVVGWYAIFPQRWKLAYFSPSKSSRNLPIRFGDVFFLESWWRFFFGRNSLLKTAPFKIKIRIFPGTDIWVEVSRSVASWHHGPFIHGAIQESLEIMLDNVTWQTLSTWVRTCHVSHVRTWRCNDVQQFLSAFDQPLMLRESTQHALLS